MTTGPSSPDRRKLLVALGFGAVNALALSKLKTGAKPSVTHVQQRPSPPSSGPPDASAVAGAPSAPAGDHVFDRVITGGRVLDPETGYDRTAHVGIDGGTIAAISEQPLQGRATIDATNRVVAPGFIDMKIGRAHV